VILLALSALGAMRPVEDASYLIVAPLEGFLRAIATPIANLVTNFGDIRSLTAENERLRTENERLSSQVASLRQDASRIDELERLLEVKQVASNQTFIGAQVIASKPSNLRQIIAIDRWKTDGLKTGMPVVTEGKTLVCTITRVDSRNAWVTLVTDVDSAVSAVDLESQAAGVVSGGYNRQMAMEFVAGDATIKEGDTVVTSGLGGTYPSGFVIGRIIGVSGEPQEVFRKVTVEPLASLSRLNTVLIMTSFAPVRIPVP
jgi:rod shape-determining protein MreC